jgi:nifR3 family TIM-barrel protein
MLTIGPMRLGVPSVQAALSGYSDLAMRLISRRAGASYAVSEGLLDKALIAGNHRKRAVALTDEDHPVAGQLLGSEPAPLAEAAGKLAEAGYDAVDVNFGCPVRKVRGKCRGGFLLGEPATALAIVRAVRAAVPAGVPVTLKMRRGIDDSAESEDRFFAILDGAFAEGVAAVTVHGRTVEQLYKGPSRWEFLARVKAHVGPGRTIIGSGDLWSAADAVEMIRRTGVDGVSLARGSIGNPWIFTEFAARWTGRPVPPPPGLEEQADTIEEHFRLAEAVYGDPEKAGRHMRKFVLRYAARHPEPERVKAELMTAAGAAARAEVFRRLYREYAGPDPGAAPAATAPAPVSEAAGVAAVAAGCDDFGGCGE